MVDPRTTRTPTFKVLETINLPAPFPKVEDHVEVEMIRRGKALIHILGADKPVELEGRYDQEQRTIVGEYDGYGSFTMTLEGSDTFRPRSNGRRRVRCEIQPTGRQPEPGCWIAEEDDPCCRAG